MATTINKERVKLWVDALRSGKFKQTIGRLGRIVNRKAEYCCLGVGCEVARKNGVTIKKTNLGVGPSYNGEPYSLPLTVEDWFGFKTNNPSLNSKGLNCTQANDIRKLSFAKIADLIEKRYLKAAKKKAAK